MRKVIYALFFVLLITSYRCKKSTDGNKSVIVQENSDIKVSNENGIIDSSATTSVTKKAGNEETREVSHLYKASDKTRVKATFNYSKKGNMITIEANSQKYVLDQKSDNIYERNGIKASVKGDSLIIEDGNNIISLKRSL